MRALLIPIGGPEDLAKLRGVLEQVAKQGVPAPAKEPKLIRCACGRPCGTVLRADPLPTIGGAGVMIKTPEGRSAIILNADGIKDLVEQLLNCLPGAHR